MTTRDKPSRLIGEMVELATEMRANGTMNHCDFEKITARHFADAGPVTTPLTGDDIRGLREAAHMSQAVFARYLNLTAGYVSQLERGAKQPTGAALALLHVIRRKGIEVMR